MGPVQVLVVGFDEPNVSGTIMSELVELRRAGIVRLLDVLLVAHEVDGSLQTIDPPPGLPATGTLAAAVLGQPDDSEGYDATDEVSYDEQVPPTWSLAEAVPVGSMAAVALIEHTWAVPLRAAIARAGGTPLDETWLAREDVDRLEALLAVEVGN